MFAPKIKLPLNRMVILLARLRCIPGTHEMVDELDNQVGELQVLLAARNHEGLSNIVLTSRQRTTLQLASLGMSNREIAAQMHLTEGTVKQYMSTIISKLGAHDRTHAVVIAKDHDLI